MEETKPPFRASEPGEKAHQANPLKLLFMASVGLAVFLGGLATQKLLFARTGNDQGQETSVVAGSITPLAVCEAPDYATLTRRAEEPEPEPEAEGPTIDPEAEARRLAEKAALESPLTFDRQDGHRPPRSGTQTGGQSELAELSERLQSFRTVAERGAGARLASNGQATAEIGPDYAGVVLDKAYLPPASEHLIQAGTLIPAALLTGVNSDLPGEIIAQVTEPIFDSVSGNTLLVPAGAKLLGRYDSLIGYGQDRAFIIWDRMLMPNGYSIELDEMAGTDKKGQAGVADQVDHHTFRLLTAVLLSSFITAGANVVENSDDNGFTRDLGDAAAQEALRIGGKIVDRQLNIQPTITIRPGWTMRVLVNRDIIFLGPYR